LTTSPITGEEEGLLIDMKNSVITLRDNTLKYYNQLNDDFHEEMLSLATNIGSTFEEHGDSVRQNLNCTSIRTSFYAYKDSLCSNTKNGFL